MGWFNGRQCAAVLGVAHTGSGRVFAGVRSPVTGYRLMCLRSRVPNESDDSHSHRAQGGGGTETRAAQQGWLPLCMVICISEYSEYNEYSVKSKSPALRVLVE